MRAEDFRLDGKIALVTGGGRGIGRACAVALAEAGAKVAVLSRTRAELEETARIIQGIGRQALVVTADTRKSMEVEVAVQATLQRFDRIDILFNNAGTNVRKPVVDVSEEDYHTIIDTNLKGVFLVARAVARQMVARRSGRIINMSSMASVRPEADKALYCASKAAVSQFTRVLALELGPFGITVNAIAPGYAMTPLVQEYLESNQERFRHILSHIALGRLGTPEEIGGLLVFLASDAARYINGASILIDGGWSGS